MLSNAIHNKRVVLIANSDQITVRVRVSCHTRRSITSGHIDANWIASDTLNHFVQLKIFEGTGRIGDPMEEMVDMENVWLEAKPAENKEIGEEKTKEFLYPYLCPCISRVRSPTSRHTAGFL